MTEQREVFPEHAPTPGVSWARTANIADRLVVDQRYERQRDGFDAAAPEGRFAGRPIIAHDTPINGGVYLGAHRREAIVVDDERYPRELDRVYLDALDDIYRIASEQALYPGDHYYGISNQRSTDELTVRERVLAPVYGAVLKALPYRSDIVNSVVGDSNDDKVTINRFIEAGGGICRHQGLLTAYVIERLMRDGELMAEDRVSMDRNSVSGTGAHGWARYTSSDGTVYVIDPAQKFVGTLGDAARLHAWPYARPGDLVE